MSEKDNLSRDVSALEMDKSDLQGKLRESEVLRNDLENTLTSLEENIKEAHYVITNIGSIKDGLSEDLSKMEIEKNNLEGKLNATELFKEDLENKLEELVEDMKEARCTISDMRLENGLSEELSKLEIE